MNTDNLTGELRRLPNNDRVRIEDCKGDSATVRRLDGPRAGTLAVCDIDKLQSPEASENKKALRESRKAFHIFSAQSGWLHRPTYFLRGS